MPADNHIWFGRSVATAAAILSVVATAVGVRSTLTADDARDQAITATSENAELQRKLEQYRYDRDYQLKVFQHLDDAVDNKNPGALVLAAAFSESVGDEETRATLGDAIWNIANIRADAGEPPSPSEMKALEGLKRKAHAEDARAALPAPASPVTSNTTSQPPPKATPSIVVAAADSAARTITAGSPLGWDIDVFWCATSGDVSAARARGVGERVGALAAAGQKLGGERLGRVRVRRLSEAAEKSGAYTGGENYVVADEGEDALALELARYASAAGEPYAMMRSNTGSRWYLSIFACAPGA
jgi:hypothetical protein